jgi:hypothetical protein
MGLNVQDLPGIIGISRRTLFECRSADSAVSEKTWRKLEAAEAAAGITPPSDVPVQSSTYPKDPGIGESANVMRDDTPIYRTRAVEAGGTPALPQESLDARVEQLERVVAAIQEALRNL